MQNSTDYESHVFSDFLNAKRFVLFCFFLLFGSTISFHEIFKKFLSKNIAKYCEFMFLNELRYRTNYICKLISFWQWKNTGFWDEGFFSDFFSGKKANAY